MSEIFDRFDKVKPTDSYLDKLMAKTTQKELEEIQKEEKEKLRTLISTQLAKETEKDKLLKNLFGNTDQEVLNRLRTMIMEIIHDSATNLSRAAQTEIIQEMLLEITGLGRVDHLAKDPTISEIMINAPDEIWVERRGAGVERLTDVKFRDDAEVLELAKKIVTSIGRVIDFLHPECNARLKDGSRVHIIIPPVARKGVTITIRKFPEYQLKIKDLIKKGSINDEGALFLQKCVEAKLNVIVSGGTGTGKTTLLNGLSDYIPRGERIITIEDAAELQLLADHLISLESKNANQEGVGEFSIRDAIKGTLRMRPDRIIVGEVRDGEAAFDLLQAMNTGHEGSMTTIHANSSRDCMFRWEQLLLMSGSNYPLLSIRRAIASSLDIIVQVSRLKDGQRVVSNITAVNGFDHETGEVELADMFVWKQTGKSNGKIAGNFTFTGIDVNEKIKNNFAMIDFDYDEFAQGVKGRG